MNIQNFEIDTKGVQLRFAAFIKHNHPDMIIRDGREEVEEYCITKTNEAIHNYSQYLNQGLSADKAWELASNLLYQDLHFSRYHFIKDLIENHYEYNYFKMIGEGTLVLNITSIIKQTEFVFEPFNTSDASFDKEALEKTILPILLQLINN